MIEQQFDALLSYSSQDKPQVRAIAKELKQRGIKLWLDEEQIPPGQSIQDAFAQAISSVKSVVVFIGSQGLEKWQLMELQLLIAKTVKTDIPVISVYLENYKPEEDILSDVLDLAKVDFRENDPDPINQLCWGITGIKIDDA